MAADSSDHPAGDGGAYRTLSSKTVYRNNWMRVREDTFARPDGVVDTYGVVDKEDFAIVIAESRTVGSISSSSSGMPSANGPGSSRWAPGRPGIRAPSRNSPSRNCWRRPGCAPRNWRRIGDHVQQAGGFCSQGFDLFHATELTEGQHEREDSEADMVQALVSEAEFRQMIRDGEIVDAVTIAAYAMLRLVD